MLDSWEIFLLIKKKLKRKEKKRGRKKACYEEQKELSKRKWCLFWESVRKKRRIKIERKIYWAEKTKLKEIKISYQNSAIVFAENEFLESSKYKVANSQKSAYAMPKYFITDTHARTHARTNASTHSTHACTHPRTCTHTHAHTSARTHTHTRTHTRMHAHIRTRTHTRTHARTYLVSSPRTNSQWCSWCRRRPVRVCPGQADPKSHQKEFPLWTSSSLKSETEEVINIEHV